RLAAPVEANEIFLELPAAAMDALERDGFQFYRRSPDLARFVCRVDTTQADVDALLAALFRHLGPAARAAALPNAAAVRSMRLLGGKGSFLLGAGFPLIFPAPFVVGHSVDDLARFRIGEREIAFVGRGPVPFRQAVAAEAGEVHQIDVLHVIALAQM